MVKELARVDEQLGQAVGAGFPKGRRLAADVVEEGDAGGMKPVAIMKKPMTFPVEGERGGWVKPLMAEAPTAPPYECTTTTTSRPRAVSDAMASRTDWTSSAKVESGEEDVVGRVMAMQWKDWGRRMEVTLSQVSGPCQAPGTKMRDGLGMVCVRVSVSMSMRVSEEVRVSENKNALEVRRGDLNTRN